MEIINVGTDIEEVERIGRLESTVLERIFTKSELDYCLTKKNSAQHLAARFAAKEAVFKALPFDEVSLKKIEITKDKSGKPQVLLHDDRAKDIMFKISLSHTDKYATAFVIAYTK